MRQQLNFSPKKSLEWLRLHKAVLQITALPTMIWAPDQYSPILHLPAIFQRWGALELLDRLPELR
jgi:hypothetical protein